MEALSEHLPVMRESIKNQRCFPEIISGWKGGHFQQRGGRITEDRGRLGDRTMLGRVLDNVRMMLGRVITRPNIVLCNRT